MGAKSSKMGAAISSPRGSWPSKKSKWVSTPVPKLKLRFRIRSERECGRVRLQNCGNGRGRGRDHGKDIRSVIMCTSLKNNAKEQVSLPGQRNSERRGRQQDGKSEKKAAYCIAHNRVLVPTGRTRTAGTPGSLELSENRKNTGSAWSSSSL